MGPARTSFRNLGQLISRDRDLSKIAIFDLGENGRARAISYAALDAMANGVARAIAQRGFERGDRIAILSANCAQYLAAYFGILRAGLVAVPVNYRFPPNMIEFVIRDAGAKLVFCDRERRADCPPGLSTVCFDDAGIGGFDRFLDPGSFDEIIPSANEPAMFLYTSGSSGVPKGVVLSHQSHIWVVQTRLGGQDPVAPPLFDRGTTLPHECAGQREVGNPHSTVVLLPSFTARRYIEAIGQYRCTWLNRSTTDDRHDAA
jgi:acyl-CoA synthetase (AMP-forming)/AMP-acid ligase II